MTRILHIANFGRKANGAFHHSVEYKITNGLIRNGHHVVCVSDRDLARAGSWLGHRKFGVGAANREIAKLCRNMEPELLLLGHANVVRSRTIAEIRRDLPSMRVLQWNVDWLSDAANVRHIESKLDVVDATLVSTAGEALRPLARPGKTIGFLPNPVDSSIERGRNFELATLPYDLIFSCGSDSDARFVCGALWKPGDLFERLERAIPDLRPLFAGMRGRPALVGARYQRALESAAIGLNVSRRNDIYLYSSDRLAQFCGNGLAVLVDRATGYGDIFSDDEFAFFSTVDELIEKTARLKADVSYRQELARAGWRRYSSLFNERAIAKYIVDVAFGRVRASDYPWPTLLKDDSVGPSAAPGA
jgi:hypothetical protein